MNKYAMLIQWSDEDNVFVVSFPDFANSPHTHGSTYEEAAKNGEEVLQMLIEHYQEHGLALPEPITHSSEDEETA